MPETPRVLVVRLSSLGDVILTTPVFENLKAGLPGCRTSVLVKAAFAPVFAANPFVDEVLCFEERGFAGWAREIRRRRFDVFLDLHDTLRSRVWGWLSGAARVLRYDKRTWERRRLVRTKRSSPRLEGGVVDRYLEVLSSLGVAVRSRLPRLFPSGAGIPSSLAARVGKGPFIAVAPGAAHATKRWPPERFAAAADALAEGMSPVPTVLILGSAGDRAAAGAVASVLKAPSVNLAGETSLPEMLHLLSLCRLVLTNDSGCMHAAAAWGVPTVAVFGPTVKEFGFFPAGPQAAVVQVDGLACRPCHLHGGETCPEGHFRCMKDLSAEAVVRAARSISG